MTGFDLWLSVLALGIVCNIYTALVMAIIPEVTAGRREKERRASMKRDQKWDGVPGWEEIECGL